MSQAGSRDSIPSPDGPIVTSCLCRSVDLGRVALLASQYRITTLGELQERIDISTGCGLCVPYVQATLETGRGWHYLLSEEESEELLARVDPPQEGA